jgi:anti-sigma factor RsiW
MTCRQVVELMTDYLEGALSPSDRLRFEQHIAGCDGCRAYLAQLATTRKVLSKLADEPIPAGLQAELVQAFRNWKSRIQG